MTTRLATVPASLYLLTSIVLAHGTIDDPKIHYPFPDQHSIAGSAVMTTYLEYQGGEGGYLHDAVDLIPVNQENDVFLIEPGYLAQSEGGGYGFSGVRIKRQNVDGADIWWYGHVNGFVPNGVAAIYPIGTKLPPAGDIHGFFVGKIVEEPPITKHIHLRVYKRYVDASLDTILCDNALKLIMDSNNSVDNEPPTISYVRLYKRNNDDGTIFNEDGIQNLSHIGDLANNMYVNKANSKFIDIAVKTWDDIPNDDPQFRNGIYRIHCWLSRDEAGTNKIPGCEFDKTFGRGEIRHNLPSSYNYELDHPEDNNFKIMYSNQPLAVTSASEPWYWATRTDKSTEALLDFTDADLAPSGCIDARNLKGPYYLHIKVYDHESTDQTATYIKRKIIFDGGGNPSM